MEPFICLNSSFQDISDGKNLVSINDRGFYFGDGVYEVIRIYKGRFFALDLHLDRFYRSAREIRMNIPFSRNELIHKLHHLLEMNAFSTDGIVYLQFTRGCADRVHQFSNSDLLPTFVAYLKKVDRPADKMEVGVSASLLPDIRWHRCDIKSLNLLPNVLAKDEAFVKGDFEAILHRDTVVTECSASNVFITDTDKKVITHPPTNHILNGITRLIVIQTCHQLGLTLEERAFSTDELNNADEVFLTSTISEVMPIVRINGRMAAKDGLVGSVTRQIQANFLSVGYELS